MNSAARLRSDYRAFQNNALGMSCGKLPQHPARSKRQWVEWKCTGHKSQLIHRSEYKSCGSGAKAPAGDMEGLYRVLWEYFEILPTR